MGDYFVILKDIIYSFFPNLLIATKIKNFTCILKENYEKISQENVRLNNEVN